MDGSKLRRKTKKKISKAVQRFYWKKTLFQHVTKWFWHLEATNFKVERYFETTIEKIEGKRKIFNTKANETKIEVKFFFMVYSNKGYKTHPIESNSDSSYNIYFLETHDLKIIT